MKTPRHFQFLGTLAAISLCSLPASAQEPRPADPQAVAESTEEATTTKLAATIVPEKEDGTATGTVEFALVGNFVNVTGRIDGLEPGKTYRVVMNPGSSADDRPEPAAPPSEAGQPNAGQPQAPEPNAGTPNAGLPNGEIRSAGGSGTPSATSVNGSPDVKLVPTAAAGDVATIAADAAGGANLNATLRDMKFDNGVASLVGRKISVTLAAADGATGIAQPIANGEITAAADEAPVEKEPSPD